MQIAIVGLAGSGKTTVFNTLTRGHAETGGFGGDRAPRRRRQGPRRAPRPARRDLQAEEARPGRRHVRRPAGAAGLVARARSATEELPAEHLARLRDSDALLHVVRAFEDPNQPAPGRLGRPGPRPRAARPRVRPRRPRARRSPARAAEDERPPRDAGRARVERAGGGGPRPAEGGARGGPADPRRRARRGRGEGDPRLPLPDPEAGPRAAQRRRGRAGHGRRAGCPDRRAATTTARRSSTRCRRGSRWSSASWRPTRPRCSWRSSGSPSRAWTG